MLIGWIVLCTQQFWDGKDTAGHGVSSGVYFMQIIAGGQSANYRFLLMRQGVKVGFSRKAVKK